MSDHTSLHPVPSGSRGRARGNDREEKITVLDPTPATPADPDKPHTGGVAIEGSPGQFQVSRPSADVVRSAVNIEGDDEPRERPPEVHFFRYVGDKERKFKMPTGHGRDGYTATIRPGKVLSTLEYPLAVLKSQGFIPQRDWRGGNLEPISADEARMS